MKYPQYNDVHVINSVALLVRAWIEITPFDAFMHFLRVALLVRAWIEIRLRDAVEKGKDVALLVRAWIEIQNQFPINYCELDVALLVRAWIEILQSQFS